MLNQTFQKKPFITLNLIAAVLLASWLLPDLRQYWNQIDQGVFFLLNGTLDEGHNWQAFWAIANIRIIDLVPLIIMLSIFLIPNLIFNSDEFRDKLLGLLVVMFFLVLIRYFFSVSVEFFAWSSASPSLQLEPVNRLSELFPEWSTKDSSKHSFPGDHAAVLWVWAGFVIATSNKSWRYGALLIAMLFMLPRLFSGAHWFSDNIVGGGFVALISLAVVCYTPLLSVCVQKLSPKFNSFMDFFGCLPGLKFFALFRPKAGV